MSDKDVIMYRSDKEILQGERNETEFDDYSNRVSQIGSRVRTRTAVLIDEFRLLKESELNEIADECLRQIASNFDDIEATHLIKRLKRVSRDLEEVERKCDELPELREEIHEIKHLVDFEDSTDSDELAGR